MHRFHFPKLLSGPAGAALTPGLVIDLDREESHHAAKVLRLAVGETVELFDGVGTVAGGAIEALKPAVKVRLASVQRIAAPAPAIDLAVAIPKGPRADTMIEQLSQLGCDRVIPLRSQRSIVDPRDTKLERFNRAALESAKQCGRSHLMRIEPVVDFGPVAWAGEYEVRLIASPRGKSVAAVSDALHAAKRILVLVGPEGGFSEDEQREAEAAGLLPISLGPHVLRIETAAVAAVAVLRALLG